ncbi:MAG: transketolase [Myxococcota bacterium]
MSRATMPPRAVEPATIELASKTIKGLSMDAVEKAKSGHPGMPMGTAEMAATLWLRFLQHDPSAPQWPDRDRFVLSAGHGSMLLYSLLHLTGYDVPMSELQRFRQLDSLTPGHPEVDHTPGVEVTTGPLGSGFAAGVGLAIAEQYLAAHYNRDGHEIIDHFTYGIVSDGDLMEGIAAEAASVAGHLGLGKIVYLYDDNQITIEGGTDLAFTEDVGKRFEAYGWHVDAVDGHDPDAVAAAITAARADPRPSLIKCRTIIARGAPTKAGSSKSHGSPLGAEEIAGAKKAMGWPEEPFHVPAAITDALGAQAGALAEQRKAWETRFDAYAKAHPDAAAELQALLADELPAGVLDTLKNVPFETGTKLATRKANLKVLGALAAVHPTVMGGSADLAGSNGVGIPDGGSLAKGNLGGRNAHFGVREHGMAGICNGIALHGGVRPFDATFLIFSDFMRGALRLSALMKLPVVHVLSHDSILVGEDGPTHQPVEQCMTLRMIPDLHVIRPADANETVGAWIHAMQRKRGDGPTAILVTRQGLPILEQTTRDVSKGAYVLWEPEGVSVGDLDGILLATGSEVHLCLEAAQTLAGEGKSVRVVSMPCWKAFAEQSAEYRESVLPAAVAKRLSVEAGTTLGWDRWASQQHGIDRFGASALGADLAERFGFTAAAVYERYQSLS